MTTTTANVMNYDPDQPSQEQIRRGRRMALLLFAVGFGPMVLATIMYYTGWLNPGGHTNNGVLITPPLPVAELHLIDAMGRPLENSFAPVTADAKWLLMVVADDCTEACESLMYLARQVNIALGKNANRVSRSVYLQTIPAELQARWHKHYLSMQQLSFTGTGQPVWPEGIEPQNAPRMLLVDPAGNVMMHYGTEHSGKAILEDLKRLLKISRIG